MHAHTQERVWHACIHVHMHMHTHTHTSIHTRIHPYKHAYIHTHMHSCDWPFFCNLWTNDGKDSLHRQNTDNQSMWKSRTKMNILARTRINMNNQPTWIFTIKMNIYILTWWSQGPQNIRYLPEKYFFNTNSIHVYIRQQRNCIWVSVQSNWGGHAI